MVKILRRFLGFIILLKIGIYLLASDIAFLFKIKDKIDEKNNITSEIYSTVPEINEKILILKDIYESGDKTLICGVDLCLKGAYDNFLAKKRKKAS